MTLSGFIHKAYFDGNIELANALRAIGEQCQELRLPDRIVELQADLSFATGSRDHQRLRAETAEANVIELRRQRARLRADFETASATADLAHRELRTLRAAEAARKADIAADLARW
jgi:hypothetical protein